LCFHDDIFWHKEKNMKKIIGGIAVLVLFVLLGGCALFSGVGKQTDESMTFWDTSLLQGVTRITNDGIKKDYARISPDGLKLLYCEVEKTERDITSGELYDKWNIVLLRNASIAAKTRLISDYAWYPSWYEDSNRFVYIAHENGVNKIVRSATTGGGRTYITRNSVGNLNRDYGPVVRNGVVLGYTLVQTTPEQRHQLVSIRDNGTEITILGDGRDPSWHPTEAKFLYTRDGDLYEMDFATTQETMLFADKDYNIAYPRYSANGRYILFQKGVEAKTTGTTVSGRSRRASSGFLGRFFANSKVVSKDSKWQIFSIKADGTELTPLTTNNVNAFSPSLSIDGYLYFVSDATGKTEIYRARVNFGD
jgi:Tol biopolymer transport system component